MTLKDIQQALENALLHDGKMEMALYEHELEPVMDELEASLKKDKDHYLFVVTVNRGDVAMVLLEDSGALYINEDALNLLKKAWPLAYETNMKRFIPEFAQQLYEGELPITGVKTVGRL